MQNRLLPLSYTYTVFNPDYFDKLNITHYALHIFICLKVMRHNLIIGKSWGGHHVFMQIRPLIKKDFAFLKGLPVTYFVVLCQYSHIGERVHGLNMMILIGGHFVFRFLMSEPQHLGHCYFFQFSITHLG